MEQQQGVGTAHLTRAYGGSIDDAHARSFPGMAHFAGTGPAGKTCRECAFWACSRRYKRDEEGLLRPRRCRKFPRLMQGQDGPGVPAYAASCRHYALADKAPSVLGRKGKVDAS